MKPHSSLDYWMFMIEYTINNTLPLFTPKKSHERAHLHAKEAYLLLISQKSART